MDFRREFYAPEDRTHLIRSQVCMCFVMKFRVFEVPRAVFFNDFPPMLIDLFKNKCLLKLKSKYTMSNAKVPSTSIALSFPPFSLICSSPTVHFTTAFRQHFPVKDMHLPLTTPAKVFLSSHCSN